MRQTTEQQKPGFGRAFVVPERKKMVVTGSSSRFENLPQEPAAFIPSREPER